MIKDDLRVLCTALGFVAVVSREDSGDDHGRKAKALAQLAETYCLTELPGLIPAAVPDSPAETAALDRAIDRHKTELVARQQTYLPDARDELRALYERLLQRQLRRQQGNFADMADADGIADRILRLLDQELALDEAQP